jgi:hypothetical protein
MKFIPATIAFVLLLLFSQLQISDAYNGSAATPIINATDIGPGDCSGTITTGGTAQAAFAAATNRHGFIIANLDTTEALWINFNGSAAIATIGSYPLASGTATTFAGAGSFFSPVGFNVSVSLNATTTGHKFSCTIW